jgi:hypothetical protein
VNINEYHGMSIMSEKKLLFIDIGLKKVFRLEKKLNE